jgi:type VI secretion system protein ImpF
LLDRLIDDEPAVRVNVEGRGVSLTRYHNGVLRDLEWLLNSKGRLVQEWLGDYPESENSVLNYGMPDPTGKTFSPAIVTEIERNITEAIRRFETRISPDSLVVKAVQTADQTRRGSAPEVLAFQITGELWVSPMSELVQIRTEIELETGRCRLYGL